MASISIAGPDDVDGPVALRRAWHPDYDEAFDVRFRDWLAATARTRTSWLAREAGAEVGMVSVTRYERMPRPGSAASFWGYVGQLFVLAEHRNRGTGRALVDAVIALSEAAGWARLVLAPSEASKRFYARAGFVPAGDDLVVRGSFGG